MRQVTFFRLICVAGVLLSSVENMLDPFLAVEPATDGAVLERVGVRLVVSIASDLDFVAVELRRSEGRDVDGLCLVGGVLQRVSVG